MHRKTITALVCGVCLTAISSFLRSGIFPEGSHASFIAEMITAMVVVFVVLMIERREGEESLQKGSHESSFDDQINSLQEKIGYLKTENAQLLKIAAGDAAPTGAEDAHTTGVILRQRAFLHDVSNPISVAQGMIELALRQMAKDPNNYEVAKAKLDKALKAVESVAKQIQENREYLIMSAS